MFRSLVRLAKNFLKGIARNSNSLPGIARHYKGFQGIGIYCKKLRVIVRSCRTFYFKELQGIARNFKQLEITK